MLVEKWEKDFYIFHTPIEGNIVGSIRLQHLRTGAIQSDVPTIGTSSPVSTGNTRL
jgi:hypothetical protein